MAPKWWTLLAVCLSIFMLLLDITVVNVALPDIRRELGANFSDLQWVVDAYALGLAGLMLAMGSLADLLGRRRIFVLGLGLFVLASLMCGLSSTPTMLNLFRGVQGIGGAMMFATSLALIAQEFAPNERGTAFGLWGATTGFAVAVGPLVGGALTEGLGWEWIFFVNVPIGIATAAMTLARVPKSELDPTARIDYVRLVAFTGAQIVAFSLHASMFAMFLYLTLYLQNILGYSPFEAGLRFLPVSLLSFLAAPIAGKLAERLPVRAFLGAGLILVGCALLLMGGIDPGDGWTTLLAGFILAGVGIGFVNPPLATAAVGVVEPRRSGAASGINGTFRQVGTATGIAGLGAVFQAKVTDQLGSALAGLPLPPGAQDRLAEAVNSGAVESAARAAPPAARDTLMAAAQRAFIDGLNEILIVAAVVAFVGALLAFALVRGRDFVVQPEGQPAEVAA